MTIKEKLNIKGANIKAVYEYLKDIDSEIGTYSNFNKYLKKHELKPFKTKKGHPRYETLPGIQAQIDWKEDLKMTSKYGEIFTFNILACKLGYSRYCYFGYSVNRTRQDVFEGLIEAFKYIGGVPNELLFDNMSTVVDISKNVRKVNTKVKAFSDDFNFKVKLCKARHAYTKGKVESANKFMDWLMPYNHEFKDENDLILIIKRINEKVNQAICQATNMPPILLYQKEKEYLQPLASKRIIESYLAHDLTLKVQKDSLITYKGCKYSVPPKYIGKVVTAKVTSLKLSIYFNTELIAVHLLSAKRINYQSEHYKELLRYSMKAEDAIDALAAVNLKQFDELL